MSHIGVEHVTVIPLTAQQLNGTHLGKAIRIDTPEGSSIQGPLTRVTTYKYDPPIQTVNGEKPLEQIEVELTIKPFGIITVPANSHTTINP
ncbi:hypothetical protein BPY_06930 [Bifidobacterium psychraerophilum]|uniref:hypothetical protein n=1 Tax=Bifidobacterium psychraerophilum TaxID=218140 RepID=UPI0031162425